MQTFAFAVEMFTPAAARFSVTDEMEIWLKDRSEEGYQFLTATCTRQAEDDEPVYTLFMQRPVPAKPSAEDEEEADLAALIAAREPQFRQTVAAFQAGSEDAPNA